MGICSSKIEENSSNDCKCCEYCCEKCCKCSCDCECEDKEQIEMNMVMKDVFKCPWKNTNCPWKPCDCKCDDLERRIQLLEDKL